jgi:hypothetical protein
MKTPHYSIIDLLAQNERNISSLYKAYSEKYVNLATFWTSLAHEEEQHASWIRQLGSKVNKEKIYIDEKRFNKAAIRTFIKYINEEKTKVNNEDLDIRTILTTALYIEKALLERKYFEVFETDSVELKQVLKRLQTATEEHVSRIEQALAQFKV